MADSPLMAAPARDAAGADPSDAPSRAVTAVRVVVATRRNNRRRNEDAVGVGGWVLQADSPVPLTLSVPLSSARPLLVAVVDGMGGHPAGDLAARIAAAELTLGTPDAADDPGAVFGRADEAIHRTPSPEGPGMGATACLVTVTATGATAVAHVGDVRAYRVTDGYVGRLTVDDRATDPAGAVPTSAVTRHLGGHHRTVVEPHVHRQQLGPGDRLLLCSDGLHDAVPTPLLTRLMVGDDPSAVAERLLAEAGGAGDNVTVAILDLRGVPDVVPDAEHQNPAPLPSAALSALDGILYSSGRRARS